ncbi:BURP domain protein USPL1-like [Carica papaya]|uniref:BURP domain protein USPL1-like n=1 Tax=Carica papaya TaxID=3649 RepID=UPI000B8CDA3A|nr:BURP domain protein USPL1-like [Carica papaya]
MQHGESVDNVLRLPSWDIHERHDDADVRRSEDAMDDDDDDHFWIYRKQNHHIRDEDGEVQVQKDVGGDDHLWIYRKQNEDHEHKMHDDADAASHMTKRLGEMVFFHKNDVKVGEMIPIYFPDPISSHHHHHHHHFLSKQQADSIPFSSDKLPYVLQMLSISPGSPQARAMKNTLAHCECEPIQGETKTCATSLESLLDFIHALFRPQSDFHILTTRYLKRSPSSNLIVQNYTVMGIKEEMWPRKMIACHQMPYAYPVLYCHGLEGGSKVLKVWLGGENGDSVDAVGVCHMDTSHWSPTHASFRLLGVEPGKSPVCHFFPSNNLVILPA